MIRSKRHHEYDSDGGPWSTGPGDAGLQLPPWERRERYGFLNALYLTLKDVLLAPSRFFGRMPTAVGWQQPLLFAIVSGAFGSFLGWLWAMTGSSLQVLVQENLGRVLRGPIYSFFIFMFSPLIVTVFTFAQAALVHMFLALLGGNRLGFEATFRVSTCSLAALLLAIIPFCGNGIAVIWEVIILIIGLTAIHQTEPWKAVVAVLVTSLILLTVFGGSLITFLMLAMP